MTSSPRSAPYSAPSRRARADAEAEVREAPVVRGGGWSATCASVRGSAHVRDGRPNQDAAAVAPLAPPRSGLVAAVADGHGGAAYVRSQVGARVAVEVAVALAAQTPTPPSAALLVEAWRRTVTDHAAAHPFSDAEQAQLGRPGGGDVLCAYGSTLLVAVVDAERAWLLKLGDGDVLAIAATAGTWSPLPPDARLAAGVTTSLCLPTAVADAATASLPPSAADVIVLATDGYGAAFADAQWRDRVGTDLRESVQGHGLPAVAAALPGWLADSARTGGDDVSLALLVRAGEGR